MVSLIEGTWEETMLLPPSAAVPMSQMKETEDCCGSIITKQSESSWLVAKHGSFQLNKTRCKLKEKDQAAHLPVYIHLCEAQTVQRRIHSETAKSHKEHRRTEKRREKRKKESLTRSARRDAGRADRPWWRSAGPSMAFFQQSMSCLEISELYASLWRA